jgi:hypothetical protein
VSDFGAVAIAILSAVDGAITLGGNRDGFLSFDKIAPDEFPYAMTYEPSKTQDRGEFQHGTENITTPLIVVWTGATIAVVNADIVLIEAALDGSTLGGIVEDTWVGEVTRYESEDSTRTAADFRIVTRGSV